MDCALKIVCELLEEDSCLSGGIAGFFGVEREADIEEFGEDDEVAGVDCCRVKEFFDSLIVCCFVFPCDIELNNVCEHWQSI